MHIDGNDIFKNNKRKRVWFLDTKNDLGNLLGLPLMLYLQQL